MGLGIARRLTSAGYSVIAIARKETKEFTNAVSEAEAANQGQLHFIPFDLGDTDRIPDLVKQIEKISARLTDLSITQVSASMGLWR